MLPVRAIASPAALVNEDEACLLDDTLGRGVVLVGIRDNSPQRTLPLVWLGGVSVMAAVYCET
jgi:hypothetical protein